MSQKAEIKFEFTGNIAAFVGELKANFKDLNVQVNQVDNTSTTTFNNMQQQVERISLVAISEAFQNFHQVLQGVTAPIMAFEQGVADLNAITGIAGDDLKDLARTARQVGVQSGLGANQATEAFKLLASQISVEKMGIDGLKLLQRETITLAQAAGIDLPSAATSMASAINQFGLEAADASRVINVMAAGAKYGAAEIPQLAETFKTAGATASAAGLQIEDLAGITQVLSQNAIIGSEAGTQLRNIIVRMQTQLGVDFTKVPLSDVLKSLQPELRNTEFLVKTFGETSIGAVQYLIANADAVAEMTNKVTGTQVATEQAEIRTDTLANTFARLQARIDDLKIGFGGFIGGVLPAVQVLSSLTMGITAAAPAMTALGQAAQWLGKQKAFLSVKTKVAAAAQVLLNLAMKLNPIGIVITAIGALVAAIVWLTGNMGKVVDWLKKWGHWLLVLTGPIGIVAALVIHFWDEIRAFFVNIGNAILNFIDGIIPGFKDAFMKFWEWLTGWIKRITDTIVKWWGNIKDFLGFGKKEKIEVEAELTTKGGVKTPAGATSVIPEPVVPVAAGAGIGESLSRVSGATAGSQVRNNNISIENLVRDINIHHSGNLPALMDKIREAVAEALIGAVRDTELAIS
ncbi:MAG TPA: phage tail tape measure protein [Dissulfurispiraceae bacterium]|nr:phage tail tape measure protein [Dissulfurispiraceae bacterium]